MESVQIQNKIRLLFEKMSEPGYIMNNYYADGLINKLAHGSETEIQQVKSQSLLTELIIEALGRDDYHNTVQVFLTRLLAVVSDKEMQFTKIFSKRSDEIAKGFNDINSSKMNPSLRVAYMEVALAIVSHDSGMSWLLESGVWKEILSLCNEKQTVFVVRKTYQFISKLVWNLNDLGDESKLILVFGHIIKPISDIDLVHVDTITDEQEEVFSKTLEPMLQILVSILSEVDRIIKPNIVVNVILKEYKISYHCHLMYDRLRKCNMSLLISRALFLMAIAKVLLAKPLTPDAVYSSDEFMELSVMYFNTIHMLVQRRWTTAILDFCSACNTTWLLVCKNDRLKFDPNSVNLHNQLLFMCLVPTLVYIKEYGKKLESPAQCRMEEYISKIVGNMCEHTARAGYALRDLIMKMDALSITIQSVKRLTCFKNHLNNEQANIIFQALFYILIEYDPTRPDSDVSEVDYAEDEEKVVVMSFVLDTVLYLVKNHNINWHESLEVLCLYNIVYNILKRPSLSSRFVVTALNVIAVTVKKFLPPNLSLLMEAKPGSAMHELGKLIYMKMHNINWEIRDSALELLLVCTEISFIKFSPFQQQIIENNLINVAATIAFNDNEFYVQASALKCLGAATKISAIWEHLNTQYPDIQDRLIAIFRNNQEGIVRKEACSVLCKVYQNLKITPSFKHTLYDHMVSSALTDFHWEVQLVALKFWKIVIRSLLNDQGMLDGTFPPVTFSRESRKIVTLNESEIQRRLQKILDELSSIGCLTVLVKLLQEDTDVDIMDAALSISLDLTNILNQYKVPDIIKQNTNDVGSVEELFNNVKEEESNDDVAMEEGTSAPTSDKVIEGILNADDINLLANIYESHMNLQAEGNEPKPCTPRIKLQKCASPYLFINYLKNKDFKAIIEQNKKWKDGIRSISSLLDDVLGIYEHDEEVNTLDCY